MKQELGHLASGLECTGPAGGETSFSGVWRDRLVPDNSYRLLGKVLTNKNLIYQLKFAKFYIFPYISFIIGFAALECIKRYWETICEEPR